MTRDKPEGEQCYIPRLEQTMRDIPEKYHEALWELTGKGKSPHTVQAAVCYIESEATLDEAAEIFDSCGIAIRQTINQFLERGDVTIEYIRENNFDNGWQQFGERRTNGESRK